MARNPENCWYHLGFSCCVSQKTGATIWLYLLSVNPMIAAVQRRDGNMRSPVKVRHLCFRSLTVKLACAHTHLTGSNPVEGTSAPKADIYRVFALRRWPVIGHDPSARCAARCKRVLASVTDKIRAGRKKPAVMAARKDEHLLNKKGWPNGHPLCLNIILTPAPRSRPVRGPMACSRPLLPGALLPHTWRRPGGCRLPRSSAAAA